MNISGDKKRKIRILGAGISGMVAGIILAKNGYQVEIFEKRPHIGSFFKRDVHSFKNYLYGYDVIKEYEKLGIKISNIHPIFEELRFSPTLKCIEIYSEDKPLFYNFIRGFTDERSLDNELLKEAQKLGVKFCFNQNIDPAKVKIDIIATGASSIRGIAYGRHYKNISNNQLDSIYYFLDSNYAPHGYIYLAPFLNEFSLVIATTKIEKKEGLEKKFEKLQEYNSIIKKIIQNAIFENEIFGFVFFDIPKNAIKNGKLCVGEAAGFLDAATGFGTHYAILSGYLGAKAIIDNEDYNKLWKEYFEKELKDRYSKRLYLQKLNNEDYERMIDGLLKNFGERIFIKDYKKYTLI